MKISLEPKQQDKKLSALNCITENNNAQLQRRLSADDVVIQKKSDISMTSSANPRLLSEQSNIILQSDSSGYKDEEIIERQNCLNKVNKKAVVASSILGVGTGLAMMPIFNYEVRELENYGINIHQYESAFIISTINTLLVTTAISLVSMYHFFNGNKENMLEGLPKYQQVGIKVGCVASTILPISLLWNIELHDQKVDESEGFDQFIAWASFCTIPLLVFKTIEAYEKMGKIIQGKYENIELESIGSKLITYGTCVLSALARGISFSASTTELAKNIGLDDDAAQAMGILIGGVLGSVSSAFIEYPVVKSLFKKQEGLLTRKEIITGVISAIEGMWFGLPAVSVGLNATQNWNPLIRGMMFVPLFISRTALEATNMYRVLNDEHKHRLDSIV